MRNERAKRLIEFLTALSAPAALAVMIGHLGGWERTADANRCTAVLEPTTVLIQHDPVTVKAALSRPIATGVRASLEEESGVEVRTVTRAETRDAFWLTLSVVSATPGDWGVTLGVSEETEMTTCRGTLSVEKADPSSVPATNRGAGERAWPT